MPCNKPFSAVDSDALVCLASLGIRHVDLSSATKCEDSYFSHVVVVQSLSCIQLFATPWTIAHQVPLSSTISWSLFKFMFIESGLLTNHLILYCPLLLLLSIFPNIRVFSNRSSLRKRWLKYWSFRFNISPSNDSQGWFSLGLTALISNPGIEPMFPAWWVDSLPLSHLGIPIYITPWARA